MPVTLPPQSVRWLADHHGVDHHPSAPRARRRRDGHAQRLVERGLLRRVGLGVFVLDDRTAHRRTALRRAVGLASWRVRHRADRRHARRAPPHAAPRRVALLRAPRRPPARRPGRALPPDHGHLGDRPPCARRRDRRRLVAAAGLRPRRRPPPARSRCRSCSNCSTSVEVTARRSRRHRSSPRTPGSARVGRVPPHTRRHSAGQRRTSRIPRSCSPMRSGGGVCRSSTRRG